MTRTKRLAINIRVGSWHFQSDRFGSGFYHNPSHAWERQWWPPKFTKGEFRSKPRWRYIAVYRLFGLERLWGF